MIFWLVVYVCVMVWGIINRKTTGRVIFGIMCYRQKYLCTVRPCGEANEILAGRVCVIRWDRYY